MAQELFIASGRRDYLLGIMSLAVLGLGISNIYFYVSTSRAEKTLAQERIEKEKKEETIQAQKKTIEEKDEEIGKLNSSVTQLTTKNNAAKEQPPATRPRSSSFKSTLPDVPENQSTTENNISLNASSSQPKPKLPPKHLVDKNAQKNTPEHARFLLAQVLKNTSWATLDGIMIYYEAIIFIIRTVLKEHSEKFSTTLEKIKKTQSPYIPKDLLEIVDSSKGLSDNPSKNAHQAQAIITSIVKKELFLPSDKRIKEDFPSNTTTTPTPHISRESSPSASPRGSFSG